MDQTPEAILAFAAKRAREAWEKDQQPYLLARLSPTNVGTTACFALAASMMTGCITMSMIAIAVSEGGDARGFVRSLGNGRCHSFLEPIDLAGRNDPGFFVG